jgi:hypothetical protein
MFGAAVLQAQSCAGYRSIDTNRVDSLMREAPVSTLSELLNGCVPGLQVTQNDAVAAAIRSPSWMVHGIPRARGPSRFPAAPTGAMSPLNDLDPNDIEMIKIMKGPAALERSSVAQADGHSESSGAGQLHRMGSLSDVRRCRDRQLHHRKLHQEEPWLSDLPVLDRLQFRYTYGVAGQYPEWVLNSLALPDLVAAEFVARRARAHVRARIRRRCQRARRPGTHRANPLQQVAAAHVRTSSWSVRSPNLVRRALSAPCSSWVGLGAMLLPTSVTHLA